MGTRRWGLWFASIIAGAACALAGPADRPPTLRGFHNFDRVGGGIYRGGQPEPGSIGRLRALGVRIILNLRNDRDDVVREEKEARGLGIGFVHVPMPGRGRPDPGDVGRALEILDRAGERPVFVHCARGADRTGVVVACHRILRQGWNPGDALREAIAHGLGFWQAGMRGFIAEGCPGVPPAGATGAGPAPPHSDQMISERMVAAGPS